MAGAIPLRGNSPVIAIPTGTTFTAGLGYSYCVLVTTPHTIVSGGSPLSNYPLTVEVGASYLRLAANGGLVNNANGYDIGFGPDCSGTGTMLKWVMETYDGTNGHLVAHVLRASLSNSTDDTIGMYFGGSFSSFQSTVSAVWDSNYKAIYHFGNGTTLSAADDTGNHNGTVGTATVQPGQVDGAMNNIGSTGVTVSSSSDFAYSGDFTIECWFMYGTNGEAGGSQALINSGTTREPWYSARTTT